ncbi:hypothetical protein AURDEDRAFT_111377 [Auricularia subglabra TFB-10046 SS5]|nr:hypothetical protein AURDEDRAFT_111377 [Auricularia subglabra TFB-10046 SS5]
MATAIRESAYIPPATPATLYSVDVPLPARFVAQVQRTQREPGRRKQRRREDARFAGNPHVVQPTTDDYELFLPRTRPTFPTPPPAGMQRSAPAPSYSRPTYDAASAQAGNYRLSVRGVRKTLARSGPRMQALVATVEDTLLAWRDAAGLFQPSDAPGEVGVVVQDAVFELRRTPGEMVWAIPDPWTRYVVHCVARFHGVVSVSVDDSNAPGGRATKLIRPHVSRRDVRAAGLHTPATTDQEAASVTALESDIDSEFTTDSEQEQDPTHVDETPQPQRVVARPMLESVEDLAEGDDEGVDSDAYELLSASTTSFQRDAD